MMSRDKFNANENELKKVEGKTDENTRNMTLFGFKVALYFSLVFT